MVPNGNDKRFATPRNPTWTRDETVLLLDLYCRAPKAGAHHPDVIALSAELNLRARRRGSAPLANFRNPAGIAMRLRNLARHDPEADAGTGLRPGGAIDAAVWKEFEGNPAALAREVDHIRRMIPAHADEPGDAAAAFLFARIQTAAVAAALSYLLARSKDAGYRPVYRNSRVKSVQFQNGDGRNPFSVIANPGHLLFYLRQPALSGTAGLQSAAVARYGPQPENERREYRVRIHSGREAEDLLTWLENLGAWPCDAGTDRPARRARLPAAAFDAVTADHLLDAARTLADGFTDHPFHQSTSFDVLFEDGRLPPKALFGMAAAAALARPIGPKDFSGGIGTPCFRAIEAAGFRIVPKGSDASSEPLFSREDREWIEGSPRLATHLGRERGWGLAHAKRARFRAEHGELFCERCSLDPVAHFGHADGEACIEVH